jgi:type I restriction enzyme M protein
VSPVTRGRRVEPKDQEIERIASTYHAWRGTTGADYNDEPGFCRGAI